MNIEYLSGLTDYYLTAYESVFDFLANLSQKKLKIEDELFKTSIKLNREKYFGILRNEEHKKNIQKQILRSCEGALLEAHEPKLKFKSRTYESMLAIEMADFHKEYQMLLAEYRKLSHAIKTQCEDLG
jgi:hypothetical protein